MSHPARTIRIFAYTQPMDLRKGAQALSRVIETEFRRSLEPGEVYLFVNRVGTLAKAVLNDGDGVVIIAKRRHSNLGFPVPWSTDIRRRRLSLTAGDLQEFLGGRRHGYLALGMAVPRTGGNA